MSFIPFTERYSCPIADALNATGIGKTKLYEMIKDGEVETCGAGRRRLVVISSLLAALKKGGSNTEHAA